MPTRYEYLLLLPPLLAGLAAGQPGQVSSLAELQAAVNKAVAGDTIMLRDGSYNATSKIQINRAGSAARPIVVTAQSVGGAEILGAGGFQIQSPARYVTIRGFRLLHAAGGNSIAAGASHCRFTRNLFQCTGRGDFLRLSGDDNEVDFNTFQHKSTEFQMIMVLGPGSDKMAKRNWIHHNFFNDFRNSGANNSAAIELGYSGRSMDSSFTLIEHNLFLDTRGENEGAICVKSSNAIIRYNTVGKGCTEISIRHGNRSQVYGNILIGTEGGLRFYGDYHRIYNNYFIDNSPALSIGNGAVQIPPGPLVEHDIPDHCEVAFNTFVNNRRNPLMLSQSGRQGANGLKFANNLIVGGNKALDLGGPTPGAVLEGNIIWNTSGGAGSLPPGSYQNVDPGLVLDAGGLYRLQAGTPAIGAAKGSYPYVTEDMDGQARRAPLDVGADQYYPGTHPVRILTPKDVGVDAPAPVPLARPASRGNGSARGLRLVWDPAAAISPRVDLRGSGAQMFQLDGKRRPGRTVWMNFPDN